MRSKRSTQTISQGRAAGPTTRSSRLASLAAHLVHVRRLPGRRAMFLKYKIAIHKSDEGYSVSVPGLPGCWSQGATESEALENIRDAIREYLAVVEEQLKGEEVREVEINV
ncbi:MAG TPA: type II toxin-antitoxin system HicB family antitoxin [Methylococcus sp.]|nr:type II toxin-antitoxin system HicB family antitoxin [Methylococcus sp.]